MSLSLYMYQLRASDNLLVFKCLNNILNKTLSKITKYVPAFLDMFSFTAREYVKQVPVLFNKFWFINKEDFM